MKKNILKEDNMESIINKMDLKIIDKLELSKTYVIGDVHANYSLLKKIIDKLPEDANVFFIGDIIEKGPESIKTLFYVQKLIEENPDRYHLVIGNHELRMLRYIEQTCIENDKSNIWYIKSKKNNDMEIIDYFSKNVNEIEKIINFFEEYSYLGFFVNNKFLLTHGYGLPFVTINENNEILVKDKKELIRNRELDLIHNNEGIINIFGHIAKIIKTKNYISIDSTSNSTSYKTNTLAVLRLDNLSIKLFTKFKHKISYNFNCIQTPLI